jgi:predicted nuclease of predicted toxin-antitoxin system
VATVKFYFDEMMSRVVANALIAEGIEVVMANDVGMTHKKDSQHLAYATSIQAVMVTQDRPFAGIVSQQNDHTGLICWTGANNDIGGMVTQLNAFATIHTPKSVEGQVFWIK